MFRIKRPLVHVLSTVSIMMSVVVPASADVMSGYAMTTASSSPSGDWLSIVHSEFGPNATVADWKDLKVDFASDPTALADLLGGGYRNSAYVYRNGSQYYSSGMCYFIQNHYGSVPGGWYVIDSIGHNTVDLGRWNTNGYRILAANVPEPATMSLLAIGGLAVLRRRRSDA